MLKKYKINEIFCSLQGEGFWTGVSMLFIRFSGCNLSCPWCDTKHEKFTEYTTNELIKEIEKYLPCRRICFTGGEPTLQVNRKNNQDIALFSYLHYNQYSIYWETNGTNEILWTKDFYRDWITVSPKENWIQKNGNELKIIWDGQTREELDHYFNSDFQHYFLQSQYYYLSVPILSVLHTKRLLKLTQIIKEEPRWRMSVQMQKILNMQ